MSSRKLWSRLSAGTKSSTSRTFTEASGARAGSVPTGEMQGEELCGCPGKLPPGGGAHPSLGELTRLPEGAGTASAAGDVPNSREMMLRLGGGAGATGCTEGRGSSEGDAGEGQAEGVCRGSCGAGWGVLGLELPVDTALGGTTGDWEPEDGLCPLAASGDVWPRLRASIISRKLGGHKQQ